MAVLHNGTGGSVPACMLWHVTYNLASTSGAELSPLLPAAVTSLVVVGTLVAVCRVVARLDRIRALIQADLRPW